MDPKDLEFEETLADSELLLKNTARSMDEDAEFSLESILAEYGSGTPAPEEAEASEPQPVKRAPAAEAAPPQKKAEAAERHADSAVRSAVIPFPGMKTAEAPAPEDPAPQDGGEAQDDAPKAMSLQDILAQTVQEALAEREDTIIEEEPPRRGLFSRRKMRDTEQLYDDAEEEEEEEDAFDEAELDLPEPPLQETLADYRAQLSGAVKARRGAGIFTLALCVMALLEHFSLLPAAYVEDPMIRALPLLAAEAIVCAIGWRIFARATRSLTMLALLVAMSIVFSRVLSISTGFVRFNLGSLPVLLAALLFGPGAGFAVGAVADMIGGVLAGYAINPLITLGAGAIGLVAGLAWQKLPGLRTGLRLQISVLLGHFVGSMVITSLALRIFYGYPWATLAVRIPNALILAAVNTVLLRILLENRTLMKMVKK